MSMDKKLMLALLSVQQFKLFLMIIVLGLLCAFFLVVLAF